MKKIDSKVIIFGFSFFSRTENELLNFLKNHLKNGNQLISIFTPNPEQIVLAKQNSDFKMVLNRGNLLLPDGIGLIWASRMLGKKNNQSILKNRITGVDVVNYLIDISNDYGLKILVIGGQNYQTYGAKKIVTNNSSANNIYELPKIANTFWTPAYNQVKHISSAEEQQLLHGIEQLQPDIVLVSLGAPYQEIWIDSHRQFLEKNHINLAMAVGGAIDFKLGKVKRAPKYIQTVGLEWLYRLFKQPWRWRRQLRLIRFILITLKEAWF